MFDLFWCSSLGKNSSHLRWEVSSISLCVELLQFVTVSKEGCSLLTLK